MRHNRGRTVRRLAETSPIAIETFTIREAAERCGLSYQAMRKRVDRGTVQTLKRDGVRRVPRGELERAGLWPGSTAGAEELRAEVERLREELKAHRQLTERAQSAEAAERQARERAEATAIENSAEREAANQRAAELRAEVEAIAQAGPIRALQMRRQLRAKLEDAA